MQNDEAADGDDVSLKDISNTNEHPCSLNHHDKAVELRLRETPAKSQTTEELLQNILELLKKQRLRDGNESLIGDCDEVKKTKKVAQVKEDWKLVARVVDRICLITFSVCLISGTTAILIYGSRCTSF